MLTVPVCMLEIGEKRRKGEEGRETAGKQQPLSMRARGLCDALKLLNELILSRKTTIIERPIDTFCLREN